MKELLAACEAVLHELTVGEASAGKLAGIHWCGKTLREAINKAKALPKKLKATIEPQAWQNDYAVPVDAPGPTSWDCSGYVDSVLHLREEIENDIRVEGYWLDVNDQLQSDPTAPAWVRHWQGPFTITVQAE